MQNTTIEQEKDKPSFWDKISERIMKFKLVATISFISYQFRKGLEPHKILKNVKQFRKEYDYYNKNQEQLLEDIKYFEKQGISIQKIERSEEKQKENDYEPEM